MWKTKSLTPIVIWTSFDLLLLQWWWFIRVLLYIFSLIEFNNIGVVLMNSVCISAEGDGEETVWYQGWKGSLPAIRGAIFRWYVQCS